MVPGRLVPHKKKRDQQSVAFFTNALERFYSASG
jgi:hypothetical protein